MTEGALLALAFVLGGLLVSYSPVRLLRRLFLGIPFSQVPDSISLLMLLWFFDIISWLIVFYYSLRTFNRIYLLWGL